jgi:hypothetical protein
MNKLILGGLLFSIATLASAENYVTPADLSEDASHKMYQILTEYNQCMMLGRMNPDVANKSGQEAANLIMQGCEDKLDTLKAHLTANHIEPSLVEGMSKKMRSRAARKLMTSEMNSLAAQAQAYGNAEKVSTEQ